MRLLVVNPNISRDVTALIAAEARRSAGPGTELLLATADRGFEYIETRFEALVAGAAVADIVAEHRGEVDAVVVAAFGDPGMPALKEIADVPVVGITEAALSVAALCGRRISIVAISTRITAWYQDCVDTAGFGDRLASIRSLGTRLGPIGRVQADFATELVDLATAAVHEDGADVVILAGAPLAGLAREVRDRIPVPVVDGIAAGVSMAELLVGMGTGGARGGSSATPPPKPRKGLSPALEHSLATAQAVGR